MTSEESIALRLSVLALVLAACSSGKPPEEEAASEDRPRIGAVMMETGRRLETAGRASRAGRWELAEYEVHEILEVFEADMPRALLPGACEDETADRMFEELDRRHLAELRNAAGASDEAAFARAWRATTARCNGCHAACEVSFVEVPSTPGESIPRLDPAGE